jgi:predicted MFS family arabinose efflux permease
VNALAQARSALRAVLASPNLRGLQLAWLGSVTGEFAYSVAISVYAHDVGGATAVGLVWLVRMLPSAVGAPLIALVGDRYTRERVIFGGNLLRALLTGATAIAIGVDLPAVVPYSLAIAMEMVSTVFWPAQAALLPKIVRSPAELTAANTASITLEGIGSFAGPALCALLLSATGVDVALAATGAVFVAAALFARGIHASEAADEQARRSWKHLPDDARAGFAALGGQADLRLLVALYGVWALAQGALGVLVVVLALEVLGLGDAGVGLLMGAIGVGGLLGGLISFTFAGDSSLARYLPIGAVAFGAPLCLLALHPTVGTAVALLVALGVGNVVVDVASLTLLQRATPDAVLMRVLGIVEGLWVAALGVGAIAVPVLIALVGTRGALAVAGAVLPVFALLAWRSFRALDAAAPPHDLVARLRFVPFLAPLRGPALERLAARFVPVHIESGADLIRQGDPGDRFYLIAAGRADVAVDGRQLRTLSAGDFFGEIALLRDVPRTATVTALTELEVLALDRDDFLSALAASPESAAAADSVVRSRLAGPGLTHRAV